MISAFYAKLNDQCISACMLNIPVQSRLAFNLGMIGRSSSLHFTLKLVLALCFFFRMGGLEIHQGVNEERSGRKELCWLAVGDEEGPGARIYKVFISPIMFTSYHIRTPSISLPKKKIRTSLSNFVWSCIDTISTPRYHLLIHPLSANHEVRCSLCCSLCQPSFAGRSSARIAVWLGKYLLKTLLHL